MRVLTVIVTLIAAACTDDNTAAMKAVRDEVCACKSVACAEDAMAKAPQNTTQPTPRARAMANEAMSCIAKLYLAERPSTDPDHDHDHDHEGVTLPGSGSGSGPGPGPGSSH